MLVTILLMLLILLWGSRESLPRRRQPEAIDEVRFLSAIAADLRAGASVRSAIAAAASGESDPMLQTVRRLALAGAPFSEVAGSLGNLPVNGRRVSAALRVVEEVGGRSAGVFAGLADRALAEADLARERRVLTTQVRMSAAVVGGLPLVSLLVGGVGRIGTLAASGPGGMVVATVGVLMQVTGGALVWRMAQGAR